MGAAALPPLHAGLLTARILVHVVPRAAASAVAGRHADAVKIRLAAPPVEGAANDELVRFLAERLGVPRGAIAIVAGRSSRRKRVTIEGTDTATALRVLHEQP